MTSILSRLTSTFVPDVAHEWTDWMVMGMAKCKDCFFYGVCILSRCSAEADASGCKVYEAESLERQKDLVEVVRCKDCKNCRAMSPSGGVIYKFPICQKFRCTTKTTDFCSYGERKENGNL